MLVQVESGPIRLGDRGKERKLNQSLVNKHCVPTDRWDKTTQLTIFKVKKGNSEGLCLALP